MILRGGCVHFTFNREKQIHCHEAASANAAIILPSCAWIMFTHARTHARTHAWPVVCLIARACCVVKAFGTYFGEGSLRIEDVHVPWQWRCAHSP